MIVFISFYALCPNPYPLYFVLYLMLHVPTGHFEPGMYAIEVLGELPGDAMEQCENLQVQWRQNAKRNK